MTRPLHCDTECRSFDGNHPIRGKTSPGSCLHLGGRVMTRPYHMVYRQLYQSQFDK